MSKAAELTREELVERLATAIKAKVPPDYGMRKDEAREYAACVLSELKALGLVLVPVEPTEEMADKAADVVLLPPCDDYSSGEPLTSIAAKETWQIMLAASPFAEVSK